MSETRHESAATHCRHDGGRSGAACRRRWPADDGRRLGGLGRAAASVARRRHRGARASPPAAARRRSKPGDLDEYYVFFSAARPARCASWACRRCAS